MPEKIYTYVAQYSNKILCRGYDEHGNRFTTKTDFNPTLYTYAKPKKSTVVTDWKDLHGKPVYEIKPGNIKDCRDFVAQYKDVAGFEILGMQNWVTQFIATEFPGELSYNIDHVKVAYIDIETATENQGFPDVDTANEEITLITIYNNIDKKYKLYTSRPTTLTDSLLVENNISRNQIEIKLFENENDLLYNFVIDWSADHPDVVTGWNSDPFDIPYMIRRVERVHCKDLARKFSPWGVLYEKKVYLNGKEQLAYNILGVNQLDFLELMKKYSYGGRESWKLDNIAEDELGRRKVEYDGTFKEFYTNDWNTFCVYNIIDVDLVKSLNDKQKLVELALTVAAFAKINPEDVFGTVKTWDSLIYNYLNERNIAIPVQTRNYRQDYGGGYVKHPIVGKHKWIASFDLQSLYPHLMMGSNISPETLVEDHTFSANTTVDALLERNVDTSRLKDINCSLTANGCLYRNDKMGFLPEMMDFFYGKRSKVKKEMLKYEQEYVDTKNPALVGEISSRNSKQLAIKTLINSAYGALGTEYFRYYDVRLAEGITTTGQLAIRWVAKALNEFLNNANKTHEIDYIAYIDTDSCYIMLESVVESHCKSTDTAERIKYMNKFCDKVLQPVISKSYDELRDYLNSFQQKMIMKREALADAAIFLQKKRYALNVHNSEGVQYTKPKLKVTGLELVRSSTPKIIKPVLKQGIYEAMFGDERSTQQYIKKFQKEYNTYPVSAIAFPRGVNGMSKYSSADMIYTKGTPIHVRGALMYNHHVKKMNLTNKYELIGEGSKMKFVYLKVPNPFHENIIGFIEKLPPEFGLEAYIDYDKMYEKSFTDALKSVMCPLGWTTEPRASLSSLFE